ncbi:MAG: hypothetical protein R3A78_06350 [Polyangiales bacterium]
MCDSWLVTEAFPETDDLYAYLGIERNRKGALVFDDNAPGAGVRHAIMAPLAAP